LDWVEADNPDNGQIDSERLQMAIDDLPDEFKVVVVMFYFQQSSYKEIATSLEIPIGTVMSRLSRAKSHLRRKLFTADAAVR
jgi:RNA polymerase sigma-70 factor (ECF subfamily)